MHPSDKADCFVLAKTVRLRLIQSRDTISRPDQEDIMEQKKMFFLKVK